ncbi:bifunctional diaminohydroxyphosphoribosylaminopyrimidine deaminase/5-amino-6-(5-phosphoribosylamino)uracil reductase RibD [Serratia microhaemolytica]|uniref:bifunctional diaminohydroxyphosphoribosylaminopyrimidine deaminase/5-amino-6-(5-phosphoribosylamino)uracil reductase RibD n=1 Tax=Serratia microhaemolytica TaxID=2675110 RepID=UPI000FDEE54E|nr:bifunctional diaminohydroxyphosphoribosylaminopyrimidine deaminase/5-amino-6-(5-phosphoribosylamino)uracil reductase RibD [Serratia microhaemolytica]
MSNDDLYMARALELARRGRFTTAPNPNVGCVIVQNGQIVGEGYHQRAGEPHAEVYALAMAGVQARGATAYVTLEPCSHHGRTPPCADALISAGISRVVVAMSDPNPLVAGRGLKRLQQAGIMVRQGVMTREAEAINRGFLKRMRQGLPYLQLKLGASLDGRTAMASGESQWITSVEARRDVQCFRAESAAIVSTSATVLADNPALTVRWDELSAEIHQCYQQQNRLPENVRQPVRVIIDSQNRVTPAHRITQQPGQTWLVRQRADDQHWPETVEQWLLPARQHAGQQGIDLTGLMQCLAERQINSVWVEAGAHLAGALLQAKLVDELILYLAPKLLGDNARGLCQLVGLERLADAPELQLQEVRQVGTDLRLRLTLR